jgi:hypothetical protein
LPPAVANPLTGAGPKLSAPTVAPPYVATSAPPQ